MPRGVSMVRSHRQPTSSDAHLTTDSRFFMEPLSRRSRKNSKGYVEMSDDSVVAGSDDPNDKKHFRLFGHSDNLDADEDEEGYQSEDDGLFVHDDDERYRLFDVMWGHRMERRYLDAAFRSGEVWVLDSDTYINNPEHPTPAQGSHQGNISHTTSSAGTPEHVSTTPAPGSENQSTCTPTSALLFKTTAATKLWCAIHLVVWNTSSVSTSASNASPGMHVSSHTKPGYVLNLTAGNAGSSINDFAAVYSLKSILVMMKWNNGN